MLYNIYIYIKCMLCCKRSEYRRVNQQKEDEIWSSKLDEQNIGMPYII